MSPSSAVELYVFFKKVLICMCNLEMEKEGWSRWYKNTRIIIVSKESVGTRDATRNGGCIRARREGTVLLRKTVHPAFSPGSLRGGADRFFAWRTSNGKMLID